MPSWTKLWAVLVTLTALLVPSLAAAQKAERIHVVALDSDDASEDQADALTSALRGRVRNSGSLQLAESNQSLSTLLPALKCPSRPDSACLQRIGDQLKTDRFIWGYVVKAPIPHQVVAEVHLWTRGKPEQLAKETYSDSLKDANDEALRRVVNSLYERLTGQASQGTLVVKANGTQTGTVVVDGRAMGQLDHGQTTLLVGSGAHTVEVQADGVSAPAQTANVGLNATSELTFNMKASATANSSGPSGPSHMKKTLGFVSVGVAGAAAIAAGVMAGLYVSGSNTWDPYRKNIDPKITNICSGGVDLGTFGGTGWAQACAAGKSAAGAGSAGWALGALAVAFGTLGVVLIMSDHGSEGGSSSATATTVRVTPTFGPTGGGMSALVTF